VTSRYATQQDGGLQQQEVNLMRTKLAVVGAGVGLLLVVAAVPVWAHHAFAAEFDANKPISLRGTVTKMEWVNPHSWIHVEVKSQDGTVEKWMVEGGPPTGLLRRGFTKKSLLPGTEVFVEGFRSKDGTNKANGRDITLPDGRKLFLGSSGTGAPADGRDPTDRR
jgi:hypothetical protein